MSRSKLSALALALAMLTGSAGSAFACNPNDYACQARSVITSLQQGAQSVKRTVSSGGFWQQPLSGGWKSTPTVPGAGTVFGQNGYQVGRALQGAYDRSHR